MIDLIGKSPKILVIGDLIIDHYLWGSCNRISPEAPVQVVNIDRESTILGGAGNVVNNLISLGSKVDLISVISTCNDSDKLKSLLKKIKVRTTYLVKQENRIITKKNRIVSSNQQVLRFDKESIEGISSSSEKIILSTFKKIITNYDIVLLSDYGKGVLTPNLTKSLIFVAKRFNKKIIADPKGIDFSKYKGCYLLTPNKKEASEATNIKISDNTSLRKAIIKLKKICNLKLSIITLSDDGIAIYENKLKIYPTVSKEVFDVTGAGDVVLASLGFALACKKKIDEAVKFANFAAGVAIGKIGNAEASMDEIVNLYNGSKKIDNEDRIKNLGEMLIICQELKKQNKKIVFTNGCFDLLHKGHVECLQVSKSYGDILIVGLNSDKSVSFNKGKNRPINSQNDRAFILAGIEAVDYVIIFNERTPYNLIKKIKPNILVKGSDYLDKEVVGKDLVDEVKFVKLTKGKSTTKTIKKILNL